MATAILVLPVIFRAEKTEPKGEVTAVFPTLPGSSESNFTVYAHMGQHSTGTHGWYMQGTRAAKPAEYAPLLAELRSIYERGPDRVKLRVVERFTRAHDDARRKAVEEQRARATARHESGGNPRTKLVHLRDIRLSGGKPRTARLDPFEKELRRGRALDRSFSKLRASGTPESTLESLRADARPGSGQSEAALKARISKLLGKK